jgi:predicted ATPase/class 3 adenylate cyclase
MTLVEPSPFGILLRRHRTEKGLTQEELAERAGLSGRAISDLERGINRTARIYTVRQLGESLELEGDELAAFMRAARRRSGRDTPDAVPPDGPGKSANVKTFLFADIRGYTQFTHERGDAAAARLAATLTSCAREVAGARGGDVIELRGDEVLAVFSSTRQALWAAIELQSRLSQELPLESALPLGVGMGLDAGEPAPLEDGYRGEALNLAARLCALAGSGEILASEGVIHIARRLDGVEYIDRGQVHLKGFAEPVRIVRVAVGTGVVETAPVRDPAPAPATASRLPTGGFLGALPAGGLVAREEEMRRLLQAVEAVAEGQGRFCMLAGEAGVGKTRLAQELTVAVRRRDFLVLAGRCYEAQRSISYAAWREALAAAYAAAPAALQADTARRRPYLARLLPDELAVAAPAGSDSPEDQQRLFRAITGFLQAMAEAGPVALLLDDLHWADGATLDLLQHVVRHLRGDRLLIVGTYRDVEIGAQHPLEVVLHDLSREQLTERVPVRRLALEGTATLICETLGDRAAADDLAALIHRSTDGNPYFTHQVVQSLIESGELHREGGRWQRRDFEEIDVPPSVRSVIAHRVSRLPDEAQEMLHLAGVLGQTFTFDDLQAMSDRGEDEVEVALDAAAGLGLVRAGGKDLYAFDHALTQQALYAELSPRRRRRLHRAAGEALERLPERKRRRRAAELAQHWMEAEEPGRALEYAILAGNEAEALFAHEAAEHHFRTALRLVEEEDAGEPGLRELVLEKLASVLRVSGRYDEALDLLEQAWRRYRDAGDGEGRARTMAQMGLVYRIKGRPEDGLVRLRLELDALDRGQTSHGLALVYATLIKLCNAIGWTDEQLKAAGRLLELARGIDDPRLLAEAELHHANALMHAGDYAAALPILEAAAERAEQVGDLETAGDAMWFTALIYHSYHQQQRAMTLDLKALELAERLGDPHQVSIRAIYASSRALILGDWPAGRRLNEQSLEAALAVDSLTAIFGPLLLLAELDVYEGVEEEAEAYLREAGTIAQHLGIPDMLRDHVCIAAERAFLRNEPENALSALLALRGTSGWDTHVNFLLSLARALCGSGSLEEAEELAAIGWEVAARGRLTLGKMEASWVQGTVAAAQRRQDEAERYFERAMSLALDISYPWGEARVHRDLGMLYGAQGETDRAAGHLEKARVIFERLGARAALALLDPAVRAPQPPR